MSEDTPLSAGAAHSAMARRPLFTFDSQQILNFRILKNRVESVRIRFRFQFGLGGSESRFLGEEPSGSGA